LSMPDAGGHPRKHRDASVTPQRCPLTGIIRPARMNDQSKGTRAMTNPHGPLRVRAYGGPVGFGQDRP
jgi:hypothetical protein